MNLNVISYLPIRAQHTLSYWLPKRFFYQFRNSNEYTLKGFNELECIFVHIPKTGGVSVNKAIFGNLGGGHKTVKEYEEIFGESTFQKYFVFSFVRNPFSRLVSAYTFLKKGGLTKWDKQWAQENLSAYNNFNDFVMEWLNSENIWKQKHFKPQYHYLCKNGVLHVDYIGRFEQIQLDFNEICSRIGIDIQLAHHNNTHRRRHYSKFYNQEVIEKVVELYKQDFEIFCYDTKI